MKHELSRRPSTLFESLLGDDFINNANYGTGIDIYREGQNYVVELDMPGFTKEMIDVQYTGDVLSIKAQHSEQEVESDKSKDYYYRARKTNRVHRQIRFADVDDSSVDARYENGVLTVILPKKTAEALVNRISIK